jgi:hypothetical protein
MRELFRYFSKSATISSISVIGGLTVFVKMAAEIILFCHNGSQNTSFRHFDAKKIKKTVWNRN